MARQIDFDRVCEMVHPGHNDPGHSPQQTLNRLFLKHLRGHKTDLVVGAPTLSAENVEISIEIWCKEDLWEQAIREDSRLPHPAYMHLPVVIVRYHGRDCLIDGGSRVFVWHKAKDCSTHPAVILAVLPEHN